MLKTEVKETISRKCMVVYGRSLLAQGLASLLTSTKGMEVISTDMEQVNLIETIRSVNPNVLVMDMEEFSHLTDSFSSLLKCCPDMRIVLADPRDSTLHIIQPSRRYVTGIQELLSALLEEV